MVYTTKDGRSDMTMRFRTFLLLLATVVAVGLIASPARQSEDGIILTVTDAYPGVVLADIQPPSAIAFEVPEGEEPAIGTQLQCKELSDFILCGDLVLVPFGIIFSSGSAEPGARVSEPESHPRLSVAQRH